MASAEPVMNLITINTADGAGYAKWAENSAATIGEANGAMAMGLCSPTSGAEVMGDHYLWSFFDSRSCMAIRSNESRGCTGSGENER